MERKYILHGKAIPERVDLIINPIKIDAFNDQNQPLYQLLCQCYRSQISVWVSIFDDDLNDYDIKNIVLSNLSGLVDFICVKDALGFDFEIISIQDLTDKRMLVFGVDEPIFDDEYKKEELSIVGKHQLLMNDRYLRYSMTSYRNAIKIPDETLYLCFRAIESIRDAICLDEIKDFNPENCEDKLRWKCLAETLELSYDTDKYNEMRIKAFNLRHGRMVPSSWEERKYALQLARNVILKYISNKTN